MKRVIVELKVSVGITKDMVMETDAADLPGFKIDPEYEPVPLRMTEDLAESLDATKEEIVLIRGEVEEEKEDALKAMPNVINVWTDARIEPFDEEH